MELNLENEEGAVLKSVLTNYLSDLRMEIVDTENFEMRQSMKEEEAIVKSLISRLEQEVPRH